jgi:eukaryotic-like serine/threonine-protein kinase
VSADAHEALAAALAGRYEIERELGRGGMATVFLARDLRHDRPVALKVLHPELAASVGPDRFLREIKLAARLQHPHVLTVLDSGEAVVSRKSQVVSDAPTTYDLRPTTLLWFTMPYIRGESLRDRLTRETQLPVEDALRIAREAADALDYAHQEGIVHRDIKPENILLSGNHALVADFGIARALGASGGDKLTETGMAVGTPAYMSPEQASGQRELDARTDIYSLGVVLYEMLAGETPFTAPTAQAMIARRFMEAARPIRELRDSVPEHVEQALQRALARTAADRFGSAAEFAAALAPPATMPTLVTPKGAAPGAGGAAARPRVAPAAPTAATRYRSVVVLGIGFLLGLGVLFGWLRRHGEGPAHEGGAKRLAVLPFENLGGPDEEYFADGVTDEIRGKLASLPSLQVTASRSAAEYKKSTKDLATIARELGVDYLLVGKVRWEKGDADRSRVRVSPELIQVATGSTEWQQPFDARLTDVFQVQADIAGRVAQALDVAMGSGERKALAERPTVNVAAYDAYLKGWEATHGGSVTDPPSLRRAALYFEQAIALDSGFAAAWAQRSRAYSLLFANSTPDSASARAALASAERALQLAPDRPEGYIAMSDYHRNVTGDQRAALEQATQGMRIAPTDVNLLGSAALTQQTLGKWDEATRLFARAQALDPRSFAPAFRLTRGLLWLRRYDEAEAAGRRALALGESDPALNEAMAMIRLGRGDLPGAREVLGRAAGRIETPVLVAYFSTYYDLFWVLDDAQRALLFRLGPDYFDGDRGSWGLALAGAHALAGHDAPARAYADSARIAFEAQLRSAPDNAQLHVLLGTALAYLGRKDEAIREGRRSLELSPLSANSFTGPYYQHQLARIYILTGEYDQAVEALEPLLKLPYFLSPAWLRIDPTFDPIRKHPGFVRLVNGTVSGERVARGSVIPSAARDLAGPSSNHG